MPIILIETAGTSPAARHSYLRSAMSKHYLSIVRYCRAPWVIAIFAVAIAWVFWWFSPRWPLASYTYDAALGGRLESHRCFGGNIVCEYRGQRNRSQKPRGWAIINLASSQIVAKQETGIGEWKQSSKGDVLVAADDAGWQVIDVKTGRKVVRTDNQQVTSAPTARIRISADGQRFAVESNGIAIFDTTNARLVRLFPSHSEPCDLDASGRRLVAHSTNGQSLELLNVESGQVINDLGDFKQMKHEAVKFSPRNTYLAICTETKVNSDESKNQVHLWSADQPVRTASFPTEKFGTVPRRIWFSANDRFLVVRDASCHLFDLTARPPADISSWLAGPNRHFDHSDDGNVFLVSSLTHWSVYDSGNEMPLFQRRKPPMSWPQMSPDGQTVFLIDHEPEKQSRGLIASIQRFLGRNSIQTYTAQFFGVETGRHIMTLNDRYPFYFDRPNNQVWTQQILEGATPGTYKTVLEKWELRRDDVPVWLWGLTGFGFSMVVIIHFGRRKVL